ncbi:MAG: methyl-accepting chemotaxis protein [Calothrix sp. SM1_5_4]|nr:methyl-accepting chemotaxis protein [Calothrix sp. SM1_5_4]
MGRLFSRLSIQRKLVLGLGLGFLGFLAYFLVNFLVLRENRLLMNSLLEEHLPALEATESLGRSLGAVKSATLQGAFSGMDTIGALEAANKDVMGAFAALKSYPGYPGHEAVRVREERYAHLYRETSDLLQNIVAGIDKLSSVQDKLQSHTSGMASLEAWAIELKKGRQEQFRRQVDSANSNSQRGVIAGLVLMLCGAPFALFFYMVVRGATSDLRAVSGKLSEVSQNMLKISGDASESSSKLAAASSQQATSVIESVSSMDEMKSMLGQTVRHSAEALRSSEESYREASDGKTVIDSLKTAMIDIERPTSNSRRSIGSCG